MRLWHYKIIKYLPNSQLIAQWRELNAIYGKEINHILINYVKEYPKFELKKYSDIVINEMICRRIKVNTKKYCDCFADVKNEAYTNEIFSQHDEKPR